MSLTELTYYTKKLGPLAMAGCMLLIVFYYLLKAIFLQLSGPRDLGPQYDYLFGKLTPIKIQQTVPYPKNAEFLLDNIEGRPTTSTDAAYIYFIPPTNVQFNYLPKISLMAKAFGIDPEFEKQTIQNQIATFNNPNHKLDIDITNFNFTYKYSYESEPSLFENPAIPKAVQIQEDAKAFLRTVGYYPEELVRGVENIIYHWYDATTQEFTIVNSPQEANVVEFDIYRPAFNELEIVTPRYSTSQNYIVMTYSMQGYKVIKAQIAYFERDVASPSLYPIKSGDDAWQELKNGKGFIVSAGKNNNQITIREMFLAYFDPGIYQQYMQPVYVFLGDNGFAAYTTAVVDEYVTTSSSP